jgi:hypothetical protein
MLVFEGGFMLVTTCRRGAAAACVLGFAALVAPGLGRSASAGVVAPPDADPTAAAPSIAHADITTTDASAPALPATPTDDHQAFWYPGVDGVAVEAPSISSVPVNATPGAGSVAPLAGVEQHPLIPLPGAASTGMAGLLGLAAIKILRNYRKLLG